MNNIYYYSTISSWIMAIQSIFSESMSREAFSSSPSSAPTGNHTELDPVKNICLDAIWLLDEELL